MTAHGVVSIGGTPLDRSPQAYGYLRSSADAAADPAELMNRLEAEGYLFLPQYLDREEVLAARREILAEMASRGWLAGPDLDAPVPVSAAPNEISEIAAGFEKLQALLYGGRMMELFLGLFAEPVRHFDFTWLRAIKPGNGTYPHMDSVFMNRGTQRLLTAWVPLGDADQVLGGLAVLEGSHRLEHLKRTYGVKDVDTYCEDGEDADRLASQQDLVWDGALDHDAVGLRSRLGLRWLTADYQAGDLLVFTISTIHIGLDNNSQTIRLSSDSRYQRASEPADPRWIGAQPSAHGSRSKVGVIC